MKPTCYLISRFFVLAALVAVFAVGPLPATDETPIDAEEKIAIIEALSTDIADIYIFHEVATEMIAHLRAQQQAGAYRGVDRLPEFCARLTTDLQSISHDLHLNVHPMRPGEVDASQQVDEEAIRQKFLEDSRRTNYGFQRVEILAGNIGYLDLRQFVDVSIAGPTANASMRFLAATDALIIDLRNNGGGAPSMIQLLTSYFFDEPTHLNSFYVRRTESTDQFWTQAHVPGPKMTETPLFVLTSGRTFSAAEEFSYNLRNLDRATIVGETTGGGAHPVDAMRYPKHKVRMSLPFGRAINPITGTNWEGAGVEPHIAAPAGTARDIAYIQALETVAGTATDEQHLAALDWALAGSQAVPEALDAKEMVAYVGSFGPRKIRVVDGGLAYQRGDGPTLELIPVGGDRFHLPALDWFRIRFERDSSGTVVTLVGLYEDGREEPSQRAVD